jgi:hypothetical protein
MWESYRQQGDTDMIKRVFQKNPRGKGRMCAIVAFILMTTLLPALLPAPGAAHSPKEVSLTYNQPQKTLEVRITHSVSDPAKHFVSSVEISRDGKTISRHEYRSQPGGSTVVYSYPLEPFPDGIIEVKVTCSVSGSTTEKLDMRKIPR